MIFDKGKDVEHVKEAIKWKAFVTTTQTASEGMDRMWRLVVSERERQAGGREAGAGEVEEEIPGESPQHWSYVENDLHERTSFKKKKTIRRQCQSWKPGEKAIGKGAGEQ